IRRYSLGINCGKLVPYELALRVVRGLAGRPGQSPLERCRYAGSGGLLQLQVEAVPDFDQGAGQLAHHFRSVRRAWREAQALGAARHGREIDRLHIGRSEEHTSELQSRENLVCRLLLEKK